MQLSIDNISISSWPTEKDEFFYCNDCEAELEKKEIPVAISFHEGFLSNDCKSIMVNAVLCHKCGATNIYGNNAAAILNFRTVGKKARKEVGLGDNQIFGYREGIGVVKTLTN